MRIAFATKIIIETTIIIEPIAENRQNSPHLTERRWCSDACRMKSYTAYARRTLFRWLNSTHSSTRPPKRC